MSDVLLRIKRAVLADRMILTDKAQSEMAADELTKAEIREAIINAPAIYKTLKSTSPFRLARREMLYVIIGTTFGGIEIYTKGRLAREQGQDTFYVLISSKRAD